MVRGDAAPCRPGGTLGDRALANTSDAVRPRQNNQTRNCAAKSASPPPNTMPEIWRLAPASPHKHQSAYDDGDKGEGPGERARERRLQIPRGPLPGRLLRERDSRNAEQNGKRHGSGSSGERRLGVAWHVDLHDVIHFRTARNDASTRIAQRWHSSPKPVHP